MPYLRSKKSTSSSLRPGLVPIPEPRGVPLLANLLEFRSEDTVQDFLRLHDKHGDIFRIRFPGGKQYIMLGSQKLVNEICDESRFQKALNTELGEIRHLSNDGLFTATVDEENWGIAHRILMPVFGPVAIRGMFEEMHDVASQLALKWARHGPSNPIACAEDFTRLALDTIALCSMDFRFNSFYRDELHPFVDKMGDVLTEAQMRYMRPEIAKVILRSNTKKFFKDIKRMRTIGDEIVQARKANPDKGSKRDLLTAMLNGVDPKTGKKMSDSSITDNLITFLVAGHETTSGTLSFLFYELLKNPDCYTKAQAEVDEIIGRDPITVEKLLKLKYIPAVLRETLRLCAPIPGIALEPKEDTLLDGKYPVKKGENLVPFMSRSHLDPVVFGEDAHEFKPERMLDENFERLEKEFPNCWKPFGNGMRGCIGRAFAWQEMLLAVSMLLQNFNFTMHDPAYQLRILETLTIKPKGFYMRASLRHNMTPVELERRLISRAESSEISPAPSAKTNGHNGDVKVAASDVKPINIYYGSNSGTCETLAHRLAADSRVNGFSPKVDSLDIARENIPTNGPVVIITSSYEGEPPDNAAHFVSWLKGLTGNSLNAVSYAVFGVGNREWVRTFHKVPKFVDSALAEHGATRLGEIGLTDTAEQDTFCDFESWCDSTLWPSVKAKYAGAQNTTKSVLPASLSVKVSAPRSTVLKQHVDDAIVTEARDISKSGPGVPLKRHIEIQLPKGTSYRAGDYLCVLPINPRETISRVMRHFGLVWDSVLEIEGDSHIALPLNQPTSAWDVLSAYVELSQPATRRNVVTLAEWTEDKDTKHELDVLAKGKFEEEIVKRRSSVMDLLERFPKVKLPLGSYLDMLPPMRIRQYSIASSPLKNPQNVSVCYSILDEPSLSGQGRHVGVATSYLSEVKTKEVINVSIRPSQKGFHLPITPETTPIICVAAGAGVGPFRGFIEERAAQISAGRKLAPAVLFFGCRGKMDDLYRDEFDAWEKRGAVVVKRAYSREQSNETLGCKYAQHRLFKERKLVGELWEKGAKLFVCGSRELGVAVTEVCVELLQELKGVDKVNARSFFDEVRSERIAMDIFN